MGLKNGDGLQETTMQMLLECMEQRALLLLQILLDLDMVPPVGAMLTETSGSLADRITLLL